MGRKKTETRQKINVIVGGKAVAVTLYPPKPPRKAWYAYWSGLTYSKSTGQREYDQAVIAVENMLRNGGKQSRLEDGLMTDDELKEVQRIYYRSKPDKKRAEKSLTNCLEAIDAFSEISGVSPIVAATADDCASFQREALELPKSYRLKYKKRKTQKDGVSCYSAHTVLKWSRALQAAFERVNINGGKKCVRGVLGERKLLTANPWKAFTWIEAEDKPKRHFNSEELLSILDYFDEHWGGVEVAAAAVKVCLWSGTRLSEFAGLTWDHLREIQGEYHFDLEVKMGMRRWVRIPTKLYEELRTLQRPESPFVFAAYNDQLRTFYRQHPKFAQRVGQEFNPRAFADWFQSRIPEWAADTGNPHATPHVFRKTALQHARAGEDINQQVAADARVTTAVMLRHYVTEEDEQLRAASNRTFQRIVADLPPQVAKRYGYIPEDGGNELERDLEEAKAIKDWATVAKLAEELAKRSA